MGKAKQSSCAHLPETTARTDASEKLLSKQWLHMLDAVTESIIIVSTKHIGARCVSVNRLLTQKPFLSTCFQARVLATAQFAP